MASNSYEMSSQVSLSIACRLSYAGFYALSFLSFPLNRQVREDDVVIAADPTIAFEMIAIAHLLLNFLPPLAQSPIF